MTDIFAALAAELSIPGRTGLRFWYRVWLTFLGGGNHKAIVCIRLGQVFHRGNRKRLARFMATTLRREFGIMVSPKAEIGPGLRLPHPTGIVIGDGVRIGARCTIYQQVTIGGARRGDWQAGRYPAIGDDAVLFAGAKLVGPVSLGDGVTVGANAVVTRDIPSRHIAVGIPAVAKPIAPRAVREAPSLQRDG